MKLLLGLGLFVCGAVQAQNIDIKITDFYRLNRTNQTKDYAAEVCGKITPAPTTHAILKIETDHKNMSNPPTYYTVIGKSGRFCHVVSTVFGQVRVSEEAVDGVSSSRLMVPGTF